MNLWRIVVHCKQIIIHSIMACARFGARFERLNPPYLVMLITVEPLESQLRHHRRFLNLWIKDISCITPSPSAGRLLPMCITQLVCWPLVALQFLEFTLFLILQWLSYRPGYGTQGAKPSSTSSSAPPCASVGWSTFLAVLPFFNFRPSGD